MTDVTVSRHAIDRALDMGITGEEIRDCLSDPQDIYKSKKYPDTLNYKHNRIVLAIRDNTVVTVGWSTPDLWCEDLKKGIYGGRHYPPPKTSGHGAR